MNILLIGYGKMGQSIEKLALQRNHKIIGVINVDNTEDLKKYNGELVDVAIEFTQPDVAFSNVSYCIENDIPVITGTTGWQDKHEAIRELCTLHNGTFLFASNFSLGVNLFFKLNEWLARLMKDHDYAASIEETHHIHKKDAPSGTAVSIAEGILAANNKYRSWTLNDPKSNEIGIKAIREDEVPGTHSVQYRSEVDEVSIKHEAFSRQGFVTGAMLVAEWIVDKKGVLTMDDFLSSGKPL